MYVEVGFLFEIIFEHHLFKTEHVLLSNMSNEHQDDIFSDWHICWHRKATFGLLELSIKRFRHIKID